ncbi:hypothetical protein BDZ97DRAFT_487132 [Flammula alnicola]|nr:hypothetical protein BDZ97DRAFT_487132 [Flammula alnicola]
MSTGTDLLLLPIGQAVPACGRSASCAEFNSETVGHRLGVSVLDQTPNQSWDAFYLILSFDPMFLRNSANY